MVSGVPGDHQTGLEVALQLCECKTGAIIDGIGTHWSPAHPTPPHLRQLKCVSGMHDSFKEIISNNKVFSSRTLLPFWRSTSFAFAGLSPSVSRAVEGRIGAPTQQCVRLFGDIARLRLNLTNPCGKRENICRVTKR
jgi:hypothetical protein